MGTTIVSLHVSGWFGEREIELAFPDTWEVMESRMAGHDKPALTDEEMREALRKPFGTPRLSELAKSKKKAIILFDDLTKPTPASRIIPFVLEEMHAGGITDDQIRFVNALGTHRNMTYEEMAAKLGADIVEKYPVYHHNVYENLVELGNTSNGTPVLVNREYISCDLRVGIGGILHHAKAGFGGGGKIVIPGVAGMKTIAYHHGKMGSHNNAKNGRVDNNPYRLDLEEAARIAGLDFKVDCVLNNRREVVGLFAGDFVAEHRAGVELARKIYETKMMKDMDIVVNNGYPTECQLRRSNWTVPVSLREGGDVVIVNYAHSGQVVHQYSGRWGSDYGGQGWKPNWRGDQLTKAGKVFIMAPYLTKLDRMEFGPEDKVIWYKSWGEVLAELVSRHGTGTKVGVYPYPSLQIPI